MARKMVQILQRDYVIQILLNPRAEERNCCSKMPVANWIQPENCGPGHDKSQGSGKGSNGRGEGIGPFICVLVMRLQ
jgi:hypothetical protein